jgi:hypothetical protein
VRCHFRYQPQAALGFTCLLPFPVDPRLAPDAGGAACVRVARVMMWQTTQPISAPGSAEEISARQRRQ